MRKGTGRLVATICLSMISGCQGDGRPYEVTGEDPVILVHNLEGGMEMQIQGILEYDSKNKCLYLKSTNGDDAGFTALIWPSGTTPHIENNRHGVQVPAYGTILEGDPIDASGGGIDGSELSDLPISSGCLDTGEIVAITGF